MQNSVVIAAARRTPLGSFQGTLAGVPASARLGAAAIKAAVAGAGLEPEAITDVLMGNVLQAGLGQAPARQAAIHAGLSPSVRTATIHRVCGSGMEAVIQGVRALQARDATVLVAGGMENMSGAPYALPNARKGFRLGHQQAIDTLIHDGLWDPYSDQHMGSCAEKCASKYGFSREEQDAYAAQSFRRAGAAQVEGRFAVEITPVLYQDSRGATVTVESDEGPAKVNFERMPTLKPAFAKGGTITAANASTINDGAAALVLTLETTATERSLKPLARIVSYGSYASDPLWFTTAPVSAAQLALKRAGWTKDEVDLWEVNEAFAVVPMAFAREMELTPERLNVRGGAISLGHPIGASGARILVTLLAALREKNARKGLAAICIGGGEGLAICLELL